MKRNEWRDKYGVEEIDMELLDAVIACGGKIVEVDNTPLSYEIIKYTMRK
jgi:hypothetical protein